MTVVSRRVAATPQRSASEAWAVIVDLLAPTPGPSKTELQRIAGIVSCLIADEAVEKAAIVVHGSGARVRVYCLYGDEAITGENVKEAPLSFTPTEGTWHMSLPCHPDDLDWVQKALRTHSTRVFAREIGAPVEAEGTDSSGTQKGAAVNREAFLRS